MRTAKTGKPVASRVILDLGCVPDPVWCWRDDWRVGGESSYCLFGLLQALNVVSNKRLAAEFFDPVELPNGRLSKLHQIDLRSTRSLRLARFARAVRQTPNETIGTFAFEAYAVGGKRSYPTLRWCPVCAAAGFHANLFQMPITTVCPAHGVPLLSKCKCDSPIPYKLNPAEPLPLFTCAHCKVDLIKKLRAGWRKPKLGESVVKRLAEREKLLQFCDQLPMLASEFLGTSASTGNSNFIVAPPRQGETAADYSSYVTRVMSAVVMKQRQLDWEDPEDACSFCEKELAKCRAPAPAKSNSGWPSHLVPPSDLKLTQATRVFRSVRRHIWRKFVRHHHRCVTSACRHLWWALRGCETSTLCPVATAFLRWRMQWESVPIASLLLERPRVAPLGLVGWLASCAPVGSAEWTSKVDAWLMSEVLGRDLLANFSSVLREELNRSTDATITWGPLPIQALSETCWICVGRGTVSHPARLFVRPDRDKSDLGSPIHKAGHYREHETMLKRITH